MQHSERKKSRIDPRPGAPLLKSSPKPSTVPAPEINKAGPPAAKAPVIDPTVVLSIDIGTSTSAVTAHYWTLPQSDESATIEDIDSGNKSSRAIVTNIASWPGHEGSNFYEEKVPSLVIYDKDGKVCSLLNKNMDLTDDC